MAIINLFTKTSDQHPFCSTTTERVLQSLAKTSLNTKKSFFSCAAKKALNREISLIYKYQDKLENLSNL